MENHRDVLAHWQFPALSLWQPWASLVVWGAKRFATRSWRTDTGGWIAIHATKAFPREAIAVCATQPFRPVLIDHGIATPRDLPRGAVVGFAYKVACYRLASAWQREVLLARGAPDEQAFGDWSLDRIVWHFAKAVVLPEPIPASGGRGLWTWACPERDRAGIGDLLRAARRAR